MIKVGRPLTTLSKFSVDGSSILFDLQEIIDINAEWPLSPDDIKAIETLKVDGKCTVDFFEVKRVE